MSPPSLLFSVAACAAAFGCSRVAVVFAVFPVDGSWSTSRSSSTTSERLRPSFRPRTTRRNRKQTSTEVVEDEERTNSWRTSTSRRIPHAPIVPGGPGDAGGLLVGAAGTDENHDERWTSRRDMSKNFYRKVNFLQGGATSKVSTSPSTTTTTISTIPARHLISSVGGNEIGTIGDEQDEQERSGEGILMNRTSENNTLDRGPPPAPSPMLPQPTSSAGDTEDQGTSYNASSADLALSTTVTPPSKPCGIDVWAVQLDKVRLRYYVLGEEATANCGRCGTTITTYEERMSTSFPDGPAGGCHVQDVRPLLGLGIPELEAYARAPENAPEFQFNTRTEGPNTGQPLHTPVCV
ncbi:unnamed protein product [Amoebophrya sp. A120]|nr:unnamed protein product [Amoebophrya sp. A120]|eukprot:GSA120T00014235001.1